MGQNATGVDHFADETMPLLGADILISFCDLLGDLILLYRCWVIWGKNHWVVAFPLLTATVGFGESPTSLHNSLCTARRQRPLAVLSLMRTRNTHFYECEA